MNKVPHSGKRSQCSHPASLYFSSWALLLGSPSACFSLNTWLWVLGTSLLTQTVSTFPRLYSVSDDLLNSFWEWSLLRLFKCTGLIPTGNILWTVKPAHGRDYWPTTGNSWCWTETISPGALSLREERLLCFPSPKFRYFSSRKSQFWSIKFIPSPSLLFLPSVFSLFLVTDFWICLKLKVQKVLSFAQTSVVLEIKF